MQITHQNYFNNDDVTNYVTASRQSVSSIFMFEWNCHIFRDTGRNFLPIITKRGRNMKSASTQNSVDFVGQRSNN